MTSRLVRFVGMVVVCAGILHEAGPFTALAVLILFVIMEANAAQLSELDKAITTILKLLYSDGRAIEVMLKALLNTDKNKDQP